MIKQVAVTLLALFCALTLRAQSEPQKNSLPAKETGKPSPTPIVSTDTTKSNEAAKPKIEKNRPPIDTNDMDPSVKPSEDFFLYTNGGWIKRTEIPPEYSRWGSFNELIEKNNDALHAIAEKASKTKADPKPRRNNTRSAIITAAAWTRKRSRPCGRSRWRTSSSVSTR